MTTLVTMCTGTASKLRASAPLVAQTRQDTLKAISPMLKNLKNMKMQGVSHTYSISKFSFSEFNWFQAQAIGGQSIM
jgi:surface antigen